MRVVSLIELPPAQRVSVIIKAESIFWRTATTSSFSSSHERHSFLERWFGNYLKVAPHTFYSALAEDCETIGYVAACPDVFDTRYATITDAISYYTPLFKSQLKDYPAHFHINVDPEWQGRGIGRAMISQCLSTFERSSKKLHVVTSAASPVTAFYARCGFYRFPTLHLDERLALFVAPNSSQLVP